MDITTKTTGTLLNELITAKLKIKYIGKKPAFEQRVDDLTEAINERNKDLSIVLDSFERLETVLTDLWWAVEDTVILRNTSKDDIEAIKKAGYAALKAFELNAIRCDIIREIDELLGEKQYTFLEKSY